MNLTRDRLAEATQVFVEALGDHVDKPVDDDLHAYFDDDRSWVALDDGGRVAGFAGGWPTRITLPGNDAVAGGAVPWVGTRTDVQGGGTGRALMEHQVARAVEDGDAFLALNSSQYPIYGRFGYGPTGRWWSVEVTPLRASFHDGAPEPGPVEVVVAHEAGDILRDLHARCFGRWPGEVQRHAGYWPRKLAEQGEGKPRRLWALHHADDGTVDAAASYSTKQDWDDDPAYPMKLEVQDLFGVDERAQARLVRWLLGVRLLGRLSSWRTDPGAAWPQMLVDPRAAVTTELTDATWVRVLDVPRVLGARASTGTGRVVVRVRDGLVERNDRAFELGAEDGRLVVEPTSAPADLAVDVRHLAPLAWAHTSATVLAASGHLRSASGTTPDRAATTALDHLMAWPRPAWSSTMF